MKTTFGRTFVTVTAVLLLALCTVGVLLWALLSNYLTKSAFSRLEQSASVISQLVAAYSADGEAPGREFILNLDVAASVSDVDAVICDRDGIIILCSEDPLGCSHQGMVPLPSTGWESWHMASTTSMPEVTWPKPAY